MAKIHFGILDGVTTRDGKTKGKNDRIKLRNGNIPIYLTISQNRKLARYRTSVEIPSASLWNPSIGFVRENALFPEHRELNAYLRRLKKQAEEAEEKVRASGAEVTAKAIMDVFRKLETNTYETKFSFIKYAEEHLQHLYNNNQYAQFRRHGVFVNRLKCFINGVKLKDYELVRSVETCKGKDLLFTEITYKLVAEYDTYLHKLPNLTRKGLLLNQNTIKKEMEIFRSVFTQGVNYYEEKGLRIERNPFSKYEFKGTEPKEKPKLSFAEIEALQAIELPEHSALWNARNCFLFAFYCGGTRFGDNVQIRGCYISEEEGSYRLKYTMDKTGKKKNILLVPEAVEILQHYIYLDNLTTDYVFPYLDNNASYAHAVTQEEKQALSPDETKQLKRDISAKNALVNKYLKVLARKAGVSKNISTHIARHSFADLARKNNGDIYDIKTILGHSSISTTQTYLNKLDTETQDKALQNVFHQDNKADEIIKQLKQLDKDTLKDILERLNG